MTPQTEGVEGFAGGKGPDKTSDVLGLTLRTPEEPVLGFLPGTPLLEDGVGDRIATVQAIQWALPFGMSV
jgi:hypothetical protein